MGKMYWTKEKPRTDGYYWIRTHGIMSGKPRQTVVSVYNKCTTVFYDGENFSIHDDLFEEWAGPIPEPEKTLGELLQEELARMKAQNQNS